MSYNLSSLLISGYTRVSGTTESTNETTGSVLVNSGLGVAKSIRCNQNISGNGLISGNITTTSTSDSIDNEQEILVTGAATISLPDTSTDPQAYQGVIYHVTKEKESGPSFVVTIDTPNANTISNAGTLSSSLTIESSSLTTLRVVNAGNIWYVTEQDLEQRDLSTPTGVTASTAGVVAGGVSVSFTPPVVFGRTSILYYEVVSTPSGITSIGYESPIIVTGLESGTPYTFQVRAVTQHISSDLSSSSNSETPS